MRIEEVELAVPEGFQLILGVYSAFLLGDVSPAKKRLDNRTFRRIRWIETKLGFSAHNIVLHEFEFDISVPERRHLWNLFYLILYAAGLALLAS